MFSASQREGDGRSSAGIKPSVDTLYINGVIATSVSDAPD